MAVFESVVGMLVVFGLMTVGVGSLVKRQAFNMRTVDGDSIGSRIMGHGPDDEVFYPTWRERLRALHRWGNRRSG